MKTLGLFIDIERYSARDLRAKVNLINRAERDLLSTSYTQNKVLGVLSCLKGEVFTFGVPALTGGKKGLESNSGETLSIKQTIVQKSTINEQIEAKKSVNRRRRASRCCDNEEAGKRQKAA